jgi:hypothetical protein
MGAEIFCKCQTTLHYVKIQKPVRSMAWQKTGDELVNEERYTDLSGSKWRTSTRSKKPDPICLLADSFVRPVQSEKSHHYSLQKQEGAKVDVKWCRAKDWNFWYGNTSDSHGWPGRSTPYCKKRRGGGELALKMGHRSRKLVFCSGYRLSKEVNEHIFYTVLKLTALKEQKA